MVPSMSHSKGREALVHQLEDAADNLVHVPQAELKMLLKRAALRLRNQPPSDEADRELQDFLDEITGHDPRSP